MAAGLCPATRQITLSISNRWRREPRTKTCAAPLAGLSSARRPEAQRSGRHRLAGHCRETMLDRGLQLPQPDQLERIGKAAALFGAEGLVDTPVPFGKAECTPSHSDYSSIQTCGSIDDAKMWASQPGKPDICRCGPTSRDRRSSRSTAAPEGPGPQLLVSRSFEFAPIDNNCRS